jgi:hypothetical protein
VGQSRVFAAYGRTSDVLAWIGDTSYNRLSYDSKTKSLTSSLVSGTESTVPDPKGSDLWLADFTDTRELKFTVTIPRDVSVIIVSDGQQPAPATVSVTWLLDNSTPWVGPLVIGGGIVLIIGLIFWLVAVNHMRRARGPRRKSPKMPKLPRQRRYKPSKQRELAPAPRGRRAARPSVVALVPVAILTTVALGGCSSLLATFTGTSSKQAVSAASTPVAQDGARLDPPAVTVPQGKRIVARVAEVVAQADDGKDKVILATRMDGPALQLRTANYDIRKVESKVKPPQSIPAGPVQLILPQQSKVWPRTFFVVVQDQSDETIAPLALVLIQDDPRSEYKVHYEIALAPGAHLPDVAPPNIGATRFQPGNKLLTLSPEDVASAYGDILTMDSQSESFALFDESNDALRVAVGVDAQAKKKKALPSTARISFSNGLGDGQVVALATNDAGALVAVPLNEVEVVKPVEAGAAINAPADFAALFGKSLSTKGLKATYGDELLFYVPAAGSGGKIILLGYTQGLIAASGL